MQYVCHLEPTGRLGRLTASLTKEADGGLGFATERARRLRSDRFRRRHPDHVLSRGRTVRSRPIRNKAA